MAAGRLPVRGGESLIAMQSDENRVIVADVAIKIDTEEMNRVRAEDRLHTTEVRANSILARGYAGIAPFVRHAHTAIAVVARAQVHAAMRLEIGNGQRVDRGTIDVAIGGNACRVLTRWARSNILCRRSLRLRAA